MFLILWAMRVRSATVNKLNCIEHFDSFTDSFYKIKKGAGTLSVLFDVISTPHYKGNSVFLVN